MNTSVIIPVWNGAEVISACLEALYAQDSTALLEVLCVDNASSDASAAIIAGDYPQVRLLRQPVNLGFAGGVNAGLAAARGQALILLNQDCLVQTGWLDALLQALQTAPQYGILGCTILNPDGSINHTGAEIQRPDAVSRHLTIPASPSEKGAGSKGPEGERIRPADFVTGAAFAVRRECYAQIGPLDEDYYPAYYEDADYCYRARQAGWQVGCALQPQVRHLFTSQEWRTNAAHYTIRGHTARYRFAGKQLSTAELPAFFAAETAALEAETYLDQAVGRLVAARRTHRRLAEILARRERELGKPASEARLRLLQNGLEAVIEKSLPVVRRLGLPPAYPEAANWRTQWENTTTELGTLRQREAELLRQIKEYQDKLASHSTSLFGRLRRLRYLLQRDEAGLWTEMHTLAHQRLELLQLKTDLARALADDRQQTLENRQQLLENLLDLDLPYPS